MSGRAIGSEKLFGPQTGLLTPFNSHTGVLLLQLLLQHVKGHFNITLDLLHDPSFDLHELSLKSATDIDVRISERRRQLAQERSQRAFSSSESGSDSGNCFGATSENLGPAGMPSVIFELPMDELVEGMEHFSHEADVMPGTSDKCLTSASYKLKCTHSMPA